MDIKDSQASTNFNKNSCIEGQEFGFLDPTCAYGLVRLRHKTISVRKKIIFWLKIPGFVHTNMAEDVPTSHQRYPLLLPQTRLKYPDV